MKSLMALAMLFGLAAAAGSSEAAGARRPRGLANVQVVDGGTIKARRRVPAVTIEVRRLDPKRPLSALRKSTAAQVAGAMNRAPF